MANMTGFSVFQPALGATLQWLPALGTAELDEMIHGLLPGPASIQDKRAHISLDFFEFAEQTGETFKFYAVSTATSFTTASPASSAAGLYDSGYGSSFNASPVVSDMSSWTQSPAAFTPSYTFDDVAGKPRAASKKASPPNSRQQTSDFSGHPGMRIMTRDGLDVTNSASRGCKTKEQRDHAHLMRIIKACDACKKKKIRCDPSHKKRTASQASSSHSETKSAKKAKKAAAKAQPAFEANFTIPDFFGTTEPASSSSPSDEGAENVDDLWNQFVQFDQEPAELVSNSQYIPDNYDFSNDPLGFFTPSSGSSSASPSQVFTPFTPAPAGPSPIIASDVNIEASPQDAMVPYLNPGVAHGTNYLDFNLYSPPADFFLDEEPLLVSKNPGSGQHTSQYPQANGLANSLEVAHQSPFPEVIVEANTDEYCSSPSSSSQSAQNDRQQSGVRRLDEYRYAAFSPVPSSVVHDVPSADQAVWYGGDGQGADLGGRGVLEFLPPRQTSDSAGLDSAVFGSIPAHPSVYCLPGAYLASAVGQQHPQKRGLDELFSSSAPVVTSPTSTASVLQATPDVGSVVAASPSSPGRSSPASQISPSRNDHLLAPVDGHQSMLTSSVVAPQPSPTQPSLSPDGGLTQQAAVRSPAIMSQSEQRIDHFLHNRHDLFSRFSDQSSSERLDSGAAEMRQLAVQTQSATVYVPDRQSVGMVAGDPNTQILGATLATVLVSASLVQQVLAGSGKKQGHGEIQQGVGKLSGVFALFFAISLVSLLLAYGATTDPKVGLSVVIFTTASVALPLSKSLSSPPATVAAGTIDNVKTKIQAFGQKLRVAQCTLSQRLRLLSPRLSSSSLIKY
ncbi:hypothetical protein B0T25DRAFT_530269 [Lasiosphaeria hispida]|uniref:Uncharacterized protein n=1 Tax=Lasiosphaeria hispida TaxID=260671 RepID=A0AAJ0HX10_9PEZI|nr:hypothetical protein B0T25DRAFT_530269 [Lasiosphaeria hispida]